VRQNEVSHVVQSERALKAVCGKLTRAEHRTGIVHEHIDTRFGLHDLRCYLFRLADPREVRVVDAVRDIGRALAQSLKGLLAAFKIARQLDNASAHAGHILSRCLSDARRRACDSNDLAFHVLVPGTFNNSAKHQIGTSINIRELRQLTTGFFPESDVSMVRPRAPGRT